MIILPRILPRAAGHLFTYAQAELLTRHQQPGPYQRSACSVGEERDPACHQELSSSHPGGNTNPAASPCCASLPVPLLQTDVRSAARSATWCSTQTHWLCCSVCYTHTCCCCCVWCLTMWKERGAEVPIYPPAPPFFSSVGLDELPGPCNRVLLDD